MVSTVMITVMAVDAVAVERREMRTVKDDTSESREGESEQGTTHIDPHQGNKVGRGKWSGCRHTAYT